MVSTEQHRKAQLLHELGESILQYPKMSNHVWMRLFPKSAVESDINYIEDLLDFCGYETIGWYKNNRVQINSRLKPYYAPSIGKLHVLINIINHPEKTWWIGDKGERKIIYESYDNSNLDL